MGPPFTILQRLECVLEVREDPLLQKVEKQIAVNSPEQVLLGDRAKATDDTVMDSGEAHQDQMTQYLNSKGLQTKLQPIGFDMLL